VSITKTAIKPVANNVAVSNPRTNITIPVGINRGARNSHFKDHSSLSSHPNNVSCFLFPPLALERGEGKKGAGGYLVRVLPQNSIMAGVLLLA
jgi:hypothetical protein